MAAPLNHLLKRDRHWNWTSACDTAFATLKNRLTTAPILAFPYFGQPFFLAADASDKGTSAVLSQRDDDGRVRVFAYASRVLSKAERNYSATEREALAIVWATQYFRVYLYGRHFTLVTDHCPLKWLKSLKDPKGRLARWLLHLSAFEGNIVHKPGRQHTNAYGLTRHYDEPPSDTADSSPDVDDLIAFTSSTVTEPVLPVSDASAMWTPTWSAPELAHTQQADADLQRVLRWLQSSSSPSKYELCSTSRATRRLWQDRPRLVFQADVLYRRWCASPALDSAVRLLLVVPSSLRCEIFQALHAAPGSGHAGVEKTAYSIRQRFYWPFLRSDVQILCHTCPECATRNSQQANPRQPRCLASSSVWLPLTTSQHGHPRSLAEDSCSQPVLRVYMLVVIDAFTRFGWRLSQSLTSLRKRSPKPSWTHSSLVAGLQATSTPIRVVNSNPTCSITSVICSVLARLVQLPTALNLMASQNAASIPFSTSCAVTFLLTRTHGTFTFRSP